MAAKKPIPIQKKVQVVLLRPSERQFLLLKVNEIRGGFWQNITGSVEKDESYISAAHRETFEETGLSEIDYTLFPLNIEHRFRTRHPRIIHEQSFVALLKEKPRIILSDEHQDCCWFHLHELGNIQYGYQSNLRSLIYAIGRADEL